MPARTFLRIPYLAAFLLAALLLGTAAASAGSTYVRVPCQYPNTCKKTYTLKKLQTKEFRATCALKAGTGAARYFPNKLNCYSSNSSVSCTKTIDVTGTDYSSCSCTNWNVTKRKKAKILVKCTKVGKN